MLSIREQIEAREASGWRPRRPGAPGRAAACGRPDDPIRPAFQRDRDRIIHAKAFRRLKHKTQVFFAPTGDHYRTRLTPHARGLADRPHDRQGAAGCTRT